MQPPEACCDLTPAVPSVGCVPTRRRGPSEIRDFTSSVFYLLNRTGCIRDHPLRRTHLHGHGVHAALHRGVYLHLQEGVLQQEEPYHLGEWRRPGEPAGPLTQVHHGGSFTLSGLVNK